MTHLRISMIAGVLLACLLVAAGASEALGEEKMVNINTASAAELGALKGIGDVKAQAIVTYREKNGPFRSVDDLRQVNGIGDRVLGKLRPHVTVGAAAGKMPAAKKH